jgi:hypothetical protein
MLTTFLGGALFDTVYIQHPEINDRNLTYAEIDSVIQRIAHAAPRLMEVDYWEQEENKLEPKARAWKYWRILILRDREQKPVTWERRTVNAGCVLLSPFALRVGG